MPDGGFNKPQFGTAPIAGRTFWTKAKLKELERMWTAGLTASEIGRSIGASKNSVISKVRRADMPYRREPVTGTKIVPTASPDYSATRSADALALTSKHQCRYPIGDPQLDADFHFCPEPQIPGRSYCPDHMRIAYVPGKRKKSDPEAV